MQRNRLQRRGSGCDRRSWRSTLCLLLYLVLVHGVPALHLAWHRDDHVHDHGGLRFLSASEVDHVHDASGAHSHQPSQRAAVLRLLSVGGVDDRASTSPSLVQLVCDDASETHSTHLPLGAAHGLSFVPSSPQGSIWVGSSAELDAAAPKLPSISARIALPRARAPPDSV